MHALHREGLTSSSAPHRRVPDRTGGWLERAEEIELEQRTAATAESSRQEREAFSGELVVTSTFSKTGRIKSTENVYQA